MTGAFSVTNFINKRLNRWDEDGLRSHLLELKIAQVYVEKLIERSPSGSERIMVAVLDLGLQLDALMGKIEHLPESNVLGEMEAYANSVTSLVRDLAQPLEMLEILITGELPMLDDDDLAKLGIKSLD